MSEMFYYCSSLTEISLGNITTNNVVNMSHLFDVYTFLTSINLQGFITENL